MSAPYPGLPKASIAFLSDLALHNDRDWMARHRDAYERDWKQAGLALCRALVAPAADIGLVVAPRVDGSLRRLHRDTRFSNDKRPFQTEMHLILSAGEPVGKRPGVHLVLGPLGMSYGVGEWRLAPDRLKAYRIALLDERRRAPLLRHIAAAEDMGCRFGAPDLAGMPRNIAAEGDWTHLLRRKSFVLRRHDPLPIPDAVFSRAAPDALIGVAAAMAPVAHWLAALP